MADTVFVNFTSFMYNTRSSKSVIEVEFTPIGDNSSSAQVSQTRKNIQVMKDTEGISIEVATADSKNSWLNDCYIVTKELLFMVNDPVLMQEIKNFFNETRAEQCFVMQNQTKNYIGNVPNQLVFRADKASFGYSDLRDSAAKEISEETLRKLQNTQAHKNDYDIIETPKEVHDLTFSIHQKLAFRIIAEEIFKKLSQAVISHGVINWKNGGKKNVSAEIIAPIQYEDFLGWLLMNQAHEDEAIEQRYQDALNAYFESFSNNHNEIVRRLIQLYKERSLKLFPLKELYSFVGEDFFFLPQHLRTIPKFCMMDYQAGSGKQMLGAFERSGYEKNILFGTEMRNVENDDTRYQVNGKCNAFAYADAIKNVFSSKEKGVSLSAKNAMACLHLPDSSDATIGVMSAELIPEEMITAGFFPASMLEYLKKNFDGIIYTVSKGAMGYLDANAPEDFLYLFGKKIPYNDVPESSASVTVFTAKNITKNIQIPEEIKSDREATVNYISQIAIKDIVALRSQRVNFVEKIHEQIDYFSQSDNRSTILPRYFKKTLDNFKMLIEDEVSIQKEISTKLPKIISAFSPLEKAKTENVFPDTRVYNKDGSYKKKTIYEVVRDISLFNHYKDCNPELFKLALKAAEELELKVPVFDEKPLLKLSGTATKPLKKDLVTNQFLGLTKLKYLPQIIDISSQSDKEILKSIILSIAEQELNSTNDFINNNDLLSVAIKNASKIVIKSQLHMCDGSMGYTPILVLLDSYGNDMGVLNIKLSMFYKELEERKIFNLDDYIELAQLPDSAKETVVRKLISEIDHLKQFFQIKESDLVEFYKAFNAVIQKEKSGLLTKNDADGAKINIFKEFDITYSITNTIYQMLDVKDACSIISKSIKNSGHIDQAEQEILFSKFIEDLYIGKEIGFTSYNKVTNEEKIRKYLRLHCGLSEIKIDDLISFLYEDLASASSLKDKAMEASRKIIMSFLGFFVPAKILASQEAQYPAIYDGFVRKLFLNIYKIKPHQFFNGERLLAKTIIGGDNFDFMAWQMRSGKTLALVSSLYLGSLYFNKPASLFVETNNINDISLQILEYMPHLFVGMKILNSEQSNLIVKNERIFKYLHSPDKENVLHLPYPNVFGIRFSSSAFVGKGNTINNLLETYNQDMEEILRVVRENGLNFEKLREMYPGSPLLSLAECPEQKNVFL